MTAVDMRPFTDDMMVRLQATHKPTFEYMTGRRERKVPTTGLPVRPAQRPTYRAAKITKEQCAAEFWRSMLDLALTPNNDETTRAAIEHEAQTWHRFATHDPAF